MNRNHSRLVKKFLDEDSGKKTEINEKLDQLIAVEKENTCAFRTNVLVSYRQNSRLL